MENIKIYNRQKCFSIQQLFYIVFSILVGRLLKMGSAANEF